MGFFARACAPKKAERGHSLNMIKYSNFPFSKRSQKEDTFQRKVLKNWVVLASNGKQ